MADWWARVLAQHSFSRFPPEDWLAVFIPFQPHHVSRVGVDRQSALTGSGVMDIKVETPQRGLAWTFDEAVAYCSTAFTKFQETDPADSAARAFLDSLEVLEGAQLAQLCRAPNTMISQPICVPKSTVEKEIKEAENDVAAFYVLREAGFQSVRTSTLDWQPTVFRDWFGSVVTGKLEAPGKKPKSWSIIGRDRLILFTIQVLVSHNVKKTRNEASKPTSAYDAIAAGARKARLSGVKSYNSVKEIVRRNKRHRRG